MSMPRDPRTPEYRDRLLARWDAWERIATRRADPASVASCASVTAACDVAERLARAYLAPARADLEARGAIVDVSRW